MDLSSEDHRVFQIDRRTGTRFALDSSGRQVVLKPLPEECLRDGKLHPEVRDRLDRIRGAASPSLAVLRGVVRLDGRTFAEWEWLEGQTLAEAAGGGDLRGWIADAERSAESMHQRGLVHGGLHERNVIIDAGGRVRLTHASPLLYDDARTDSADLSSMRRRLLAESDGVAATVPGLPAGMPVESAEAVSGGAVQWRWTPLLLAGLLAAAALGWVVRSVRPAVAPPPPLPVQVEPDEAIPPISDGAR